MASKKVATNMEENDSEYFNISNKSQSQSSGNSTISGNNSCGSSGYGGTNSSKNERSKRKNKSSSQLLKPNITDISEERDIIQKTVNDINIVNEKNSCDIISAINNKDAVKQNSSDTLNCNTKSTANIENVQNQNNSKENGFYIIISLKDGVILHATIGLTKILGYFTDMWSGRLLMDFIRPQDHASLGSVIAKTVADMLLENINNCKKSPKTWTYVMLRRYHSLKNEGYRVSTNNINYEPFRITLSLKKYESKKVDQLYDCDEYDSNYFLILNAVRVKGFYSTSEEKVRSPQFGTQHNNAGIITHIDENAVNLLGYFPHDVVGKSIIEFYHPEDLQYLNEIYKLIVTKSLHQNKSFCGDTYRFLTQNGDYVLMETNWSCIFNVFSGKLEFITGLHQVIQGPANYEIFAFSKKTRNRREEMKKIHQTSYDSIIQLLSTPNFHPFNKMRDELAARCKSLESYTFSHIDEIRKNNLILDLLAEAKHTLSEKGSIIIGAISPNNEYCNTNVSETPLSYNQLNYTENIQRFLDSKPITIIENSISKLDEIMNDDFNSTITNEENGQTGTTGSINSENIQIKGQINKLLFDQVQYIEKSPLLTEAVLHKHNEDMQKVLLSKYCDSRAKLNKQLKDNTNKSQDNPLLFGIKRSIPKSWEEEVRKTSKYDHTQDNTKELDENINNSVMNMLPEIPEVSNDKNWISNLPFSVNITKQTIKCTSANNFNTYSPLCQLTKPIKNDFAMQYMSMNPYLSLISSSTKLICYPFSVNTIFPNIKLSEEAHLLQIFNDDQKQMVRLKKDENIKTENTKCLPMVNELQKENFENMDTSTSNEKSDDTDEASISSFYSSFFKTDTSSDSPQDFIRYPINAIEASVCNIKSIQETLACRRPESSWPHSTVLTSDLSYNYQITSRKVADVLKSDLCILKNLRQPLMVNDQLHQLYLDFEEEDSKISLKLSCNTSDSSNSGNEDSGKENKSILRIFNDDI